MAITSRTRLWIWIISVVVIVGAGATVGYFLLRDQTEETATSLADIIITPPPPPDTTPTPPPTFTPPPPTPTPSQPPTLSPSAPPTVQPSAPSAGGGNGDFLAGSGSVTGTAVGLGQASRTLASGEPLPTESPETGIGAIAVSTLAGLSAVGTAGVFMRRRRSK